MSNELTTTLGVELTNNALQALTVQRNQLKKFISDQLEKDSDYGLIPGTKKDCLFKPGAEKLANIFKLGSRIIKNEKQMDIEKNFACISITIEIYSLVSGVAISTCEGICNSMESKYKSRPMVDMLNTLSKMAQKRAFVGAVIMATGASDFFTQDLEDMPDMNLSYDSQPTVKDVGPVETFVMTHGNVKVKGKKLGDCDQKDLLDMMDFFTKNGTERPTGGVAVQIGKTKEYLAKTYPAKA